MKRIITCCLLGCALSAMAQTSEQFSIATLNVDGLPKKILVFNVNADGPGDAGSSRIGKYLIKKNYDLVFMQEDFNYHEVMKVWLEDDYKLDEWTGDVEVVDHQIDFLHLQNHRFECDGLMACWKNDLTVTTSPRTAWKQNFGKFSHALDELPPRLGEIARLRLDHPAAALQELGSLCEPPVGKAAVSIRFRQLMELIGGKGSA